MLVNMVNCTNRNSPEVFFLFFFTLNQFSRDVKQVIQLSVVFNDCSFNVYLVTNDMCTWRRATVSEQIF